MDEVMQRRLGDMRMHLSHKNLQLKQFSPESKIQSMRFLTIRTQEQMQARMESILQIYRKELAIRIERLKGVSPLDKLNQGFSYVETEDGRTVKDIRDVKEGDLLTVQVKNGKILARTEKVISHKWQS